MVVTSKSAPGFYAVRRGKGGLRGCIFLEWNDCKGFVDDQETAEFSVFDKVEEAVEYLQTKKRPHKRKRIGVLINNKPPKKARSVTNISEEKGEEKEASAQEDEQPEEQEDGDSDGSSGSDSNGPKKKKKRSSAKAAGKVASAATVDAKTKKRIKEAKTKPLVDQLRHSYETKRPKGWRAADLDMYLNNRDYPRDVAKAQYIKDLNELQDYRSKQFHSHVVGRTVGVEKHFSGASHPLSVFYLNWAWGVSNSYHRDIRRQQKQKNPKQRDKLPVFKTHQQPLPTRKPKEHVYSVPPVPPPHYYPYPYPHPGYAPPPPPHGATQSGATQDGAVPPPPMHYYPYPYPPPAPQSSSTAAAPPMPIPTIEDKNGEAEVVEESPTDAVTAAIMKTKAASASVRSPATMKAAQALVDASAAGDATGGTTTTGSPNSPVEPPIVTSAVIAAHPNASASVTEISPTESESRAAAPSASHPTESAPSTMTEEDVMQQIPEDRYKDKPPLMADLKLGWFHNRDKGWRARELGFSEDDVQQAEKSNDFNSNESLAEAFLKDLTNLREFHEQYPSSSLQMFLPLGVRHTHVSGISCPWSVAYFNWSWGVDAYYKLARTKENRPFPSTEGECDETVDEAVEETV
jgi:hypothetical protein